MMIMMIMIIMILTQSGAKLDEITVVSRKLKEILHNVDKDYSRISYDIDHDSYVKHNSWGYVERIIKSNTDEQLTFAQTECISFPINRFAALNPNKLFRIPAWIHHLPPP